MDQVRRLNSLRSRGGYASLDNTHPACPLDFSSNDYLGLRNHPQVQQAIVQAIQTYGWGSGASPVLSGYSSAHSGLERQLAQLCGTQDSLVFASGFSCNVGVLSCLLDEQTIVFSDRLNHASLIDGMRLGRSKKIIYDHCDATHLERELTAHREYYQRALIVTESVFSMDGDEAPLKRIAELSRQYDCGLVVDEAHAVGVFGRRGGGLLEELELTESALIKFGTLSKAIGGIGGYAAGASQVVETLVNRCRSYLFSTAPPAASAVASQTAVQLLQEMSPERYHLEQLSQYTRSRLTAMGWQVLPGRSPIIPVVVGQADMAIRLSQALRESGICVPAIRPPTVPAGTCRLRVSLTVRHRKEDVERLCEALAKLG